MYHLIRSGKEWSVNVLIGRENERKRLRDLLETDKSEFVAVYGRRRIGKTFLIRESYGYQFAFEHTGLRKGGIKKQLKAFREKLCKCGYKSCPNLKDWAEAFLRLGELLEMKPNGKKVVFLDECPWLDTARSGFLDELDHFWNDWCTMRKDIVLVICGSAASWIVEKVIDNYGGLHNRLTRQVYLRPFTLHECEDMARAKGIVFNRRQILECYMVMVGVPYYWDLLDKSLGLAQNIDALFFRRKGELSEEFDHLYSSLFRIPEPYLKVISALGKKRYGLTRDEIVAVTKIPSSGNLTKVLKALVQCDFVRTYCLPGRSSRECIYQLVDNFTIFHQRFLDDIINNGEEMLKPTLFMQSTHNTLGSEIAIRCKCHGYNITYSCGDDSEKWAMRDAVRQLKTGKARSVLVGCFDESTFLTDSICKKSGKPVYPEIFALTRVLVSKNNNK